MLPTWWLSCSLLVVAEQSHLRNVLVNAMVVQPVLAPDRANAMLQSTGKLPAVGCWFGSVVASK